MGTDDGPAETCKHTGSDLKAYGDQANNCWAAGGSTPSALMSHFCMPSLTGELADEARQVLVDRSRSLYLLSSCIALSNGRNVCPGQNKTWSQIFCHDIALTQGIKGRSFV